jgi:hypothetical protein
MENSKPIESNNLKVIKDELGYEALMCKKYTECSSQCTDEQLKKVCTDAGNVHKQNFCELKTYLDSHQ